MDEIENSQVTNTISTLEQLHDSVGSQQVMEDVDNAVIVKPVEAVEQKLADFVADAFKATNKDLAFNESLKSEIVKAFLFLVRLVVQVNVSPKKVSLLNLIFIFFNL